MKNLVTLLVFIFALTSLISCGATGQNCVSTETIKVQKVETPKIVISKEVLETENT